MTPDETFDQYACAMLTGLGARLADSVLGGGIPEPATVSAMVATVMATAKQAYNSRDQYRPENTGGGNT